MDFGERLKHLRENIDMTRDDLANKLNISYSTISKYETNVRFPDQEMLVKIADLFNVSTDYLLGRSDIPNPYIKEHTSATDEIASLSTESQEELKKLIELYKIRDMQKRNSEAADELTNIE